jgi:hypothetical protein
MYSVGGEGRVIINFEEAVYNLFNVEGSVNIGQLLKVRSSPFSITSTHSLLSTVS